MAEPMNPTPPAATRLILIEGIPGSGKTSTASWLAERLRARGLRVAWVREEAADHPVIGRDTRRTGKHPGYGERCAARWRAFATKEIQRADRELIILEGVLFQSTVRFMLEYRRAQDEPTRYFDTTEEILRPLNPWLLYYSHPEPRLYLEHEIDARKSAPYVDKIAHYTETTPFARQGGWRGRRALVEFYSHYESVCRTLVARSHLPRLDLDASRSQWEATRRHLSAWIEVNGFDPPT